MTLSHTCFNIHSKLKAIIPNIQRSQVYELLSAQLGFHTYKHLCEDAIVLSGLGYQDFKIHHSTLLNQRIQELGFTISNEQFKEMALFIQNELEQQQIYVSRVKDFTKTLLKSIDYRQGFDVLDSNRFYKDLNNACFSDKPNLNAMVLHLFLLSRIEPEWDEGQKTKQRVNKIIQQAVETFGKEIILPYLVIFHLAQNEDVNFIKAFYHQETLREVIADYVSKNDALKSHAFYQLALKFGCNDILAGKNSKIHTEETTYENRGLYSFYDDGEWFNFWEEEGYEPITLPELDKSLNSKLDKLVNEFYQLYQDTQKSIEYAKNSFIFTGFNHRTISYYWYDEFDDENDFWEDEE